MSQQAVESVIGRLACDEEYRERFAQHRAALVSELLRGGVPLTTIECCALLETDVTACEEFAASLDPRIQKVDLRRAHARSISAPARVGGENVGAAVALRALVAFLDPRLEDGGVTDMAAALAHDHGARLTGVYVVPELITDEHDMFVRGGAIRTVVAEHQARIVEAETTRRHLLETAAIRYGIESEWRTMTGFMSDAAAAHVRAGDLAVIARCEPSDDHWDNRRLLTTLILTSGRPIIVVPPHCPTTRLRRVLVGWNATREAARALADAMPLLVKAEAVAVLAVDAEAATTAHNEGPGDDVVRHLVRQGARVEARRASSAGEDVGRVILAEAGVFGADLVVVGAYGRSRLSEQLFGGATHTMLREAKLPVLMSH